MYDTSRIFTVKVVLRGVSRKPGVTEIELEGKPFHISGDPESATWPGVNLRPGDLEAVGWTNGAGVDEIVPKLKARADVVAVGVA